MGRTLKRNRKNRTKTLRHKAYEQEGGKGFLANAHRAFKTLFGHERGDSQRKRLAASHAEIEKLESSVEDRSSLSAIMAEYSALEKDVTKFSTVSKQLEALRESNKAGLDKLAQMINSAKAAHSAAADHASAGQASAGQASAPHAQEAASNPPGLDMAKVTEESRILPGQLAHSQRAAASPDSRDPSRTVKVTDTKEPTVRDAPTQREPGSDPHPMAGGKKTRRRRRRGRGTRRQKGGMRRSRPSPVQGKPWSPSNVKTWGRSNYLSRNKNVRTNPSPAR